MPVKSRAAPALPGAEPVGPAWPSSAVVGGPLAHLWVVVRVGMRRAESDFRNAL